LRNNKLRLSLTCAVFMNSVARLIGPIAISHVSRNLYPPFSINPGRRILNKRSTNFRIDNALEIESVAGAKIRAVPGLDFRELENLERELRQSLDWTS